jgi:two-component system NtrC family sensor kinase
VCSADVNQITQVLLNIVLNSIQACERGDHVKIVLKNEKDKQSKGDAFARIDVMDDGVGVPPEVRGNLFEPFVTTKTHGTGLGLAISQQIVEEHRGKISCEFLDKGTCFTIRLPIGREAQVDRGVQT